MPASGFVHRRTRCPIEVDVLCGDLATAWSSIKDQMSIVETTTEFRTLIGQELDVEQMLRTSLEYIMEKVGPTNGVVFLREAEGDYGVGAYVNYEWQDRKHPAHARTAWIRGLSADAGGPGSVEVRRRQ